MRPRIDRGVYLLGNNRWDAIFTPQAESGLLDGFRAKWRICTHG